MANFKRGRKTCARRKKDFLKMNVGSMCKQDKKLKERNKHWTKNDIMKEYGDEVPDYLKYYDLDDDYGDWYNEELLECNPGHLWVSPSDI